MSELLFSVVIPTRDQKERLAATLDSIAAAEADLQQIEVIVVDDGSTDGTLESLRGRNDPYSLQVHRVEFSSQSATTNEAIRRAGGRYILSSAQDILFDPKMFAEHLRWHERFEGEEIVVLGDLPYPPGLDVTPFMFYLVSGGFQFAYYRIRDPLNVPSDYLYAPNFSIRRDVLCRVGAFDERFPFGCQDTDLGIRLARGGVRMVYNPDAIGYHNHPVELDGYCKRQQTVGRAMVHLERKHPDCEGGMVLHDRVLVDYVMRSVASLDHAREEVRSAESCLAESGRSYQGLWDRAFCQQQALEGPTTDEQRTLVATEKLFKAYQKILSFHWAEGYMDESIRVCGVEAVGHWVRNRLRKGQASIQTRRVAETRLRRLGMPMTLQTPRDHRRCVVAHGFPDYAAAAHYLEQFQDPPAARCNYQLILAVCEQTLSPEETKKLTELAEVVICTNTDRAIGDALSRCETELVTVSHYASTLPHSTVETAAEKLFDRLPDLTVLFGAPRGATRGRPSATNHAYEMCWLRRSTVDALLGHLAAEDDPSFPWCRRIRDAALAAEREVAYLPEIAAGGAPAPAREMARQSA